MRRRLLLLLAAVALLAAALPASAGTPFDACRNGNTMAPDGARRDSLGLWSETCGNFNWHFEDARNDDNLTFAQKSAVKRSLYEFTCGGDGFANGYAGPGAGSCFRTGERRTAGILHALGPAIDHTADGGTVYLPEGIYVDTGCGTLSDGVTRAQCPRPYLADRRARSDFAQTGVHALRGRITVERGITLIGEGSPEFAQADEGDATVTKHRPKLTGTWILQDRGNAGEASSFGTGCAGSDCRTSDGPSENLENTSYTISVGGPDYSAGTVPYCDISPSSADCAEEQNADEFFNPAPFYPYGATTSILANTSEAGGTICLGDTPSGTSDATYTGVCSLNPLVRCGAAGASIARASHGCGTVAANGYDFGTCQGVVTQLAADNAAGKRYGLQFLVAQCADNPTSNAQCDANTGNASYLTEVRTFGAVCSTTGLTITPGTNGSVNARAWPFPFGDFLTGGGGTNSVRVIDRDKFHAGSTIQGIGILPANWVGRDSATAAADCLSGGDTDNADDEAACDTQTLLGFGSGNGRAVGVHVVNASQALSLASAIDFRGAGVDRVVEGNRFSNQRRGTWFDLCDVRFENNTLSGVASQESVAVGATALAIYCKNTRILRNIFRTVGAGQAFINLGFPARDVEIAENITTNIRAAQWLNVQAANGLSVRHNRVYGQDGGVGIMLDVGAAATTGALPWKKVAIEGNTFAGGLGASLEGTSMPTAAIVVRADGASTTRADDITELSITNNYATTDEDDLCAVWLEDDCAAAGSGGCTGADAAALVTEARARWNIHGNAAWSDGAPRAVCQGNYRAGVGHEDATDSDDPLKQRYAPRALGNTANGVLEEGSWLNGQAAASTPDCDLTTACTAGTVVKIIDDTAANACTDAGADDQLDGGGTAVSICKYNGTAWGPL